MSQETLDSTNQGEAVFNSPEEAAAITESLHKLVGAAREAGAVTPFSRDIHTVVGDFDPTGVDPENSRLGVVVEKRIPVQQPAGLETTTWRTYTDDTGESSYRWAISFPKGDETATPMVTLETPTNYNPATDMNLNPTSGIRPEGRRIQDFIINPDGTVAVRTGDYTVVGEQYRVKGVGDTSQATEAQVAFLRQNLGEAELLKKGDRTGVTAKEVAPELSGAN